MALGARAEQVSRLVMVQGVAPVIAGLVIGVGRVVAEVCRSFERRTPKPRRTDSGHTKL